MQYEIFDDFKDGMVLTAIPLSWFRKVTDFIKNISGGGVIKMRNENGAPTATIDTAVSQKENLKTEMTPFRDEDGDEIEDTFFDGDTGKDNTSWGVNEQNADNKNGCIVTLPTRMEHPLKDGSQTERDESKIRMWFRSFGKSSAGITAQISSEIGYKDFPLGEHGEETNPSPTSGVSVTPDFNFEGAIPYFTQPDLNPRGKDDVWVPHVHLTGDDIQRTPVGWERGKTAWKNGHNVNDPTDLDPETGEPYKPVGASIKVISHAIRRNNMASLETKTELFFAQLDFDENGQLVRAIPCSDWFVIP